MYVSAKPLLLLGPVHKIRLLCMIHDHLGIGLSLLSTIPDFDSLANVAVRPDVSC